MREREKENKIESVRHIREKAFTFSSFSYLFIYNGREIIRLHVTELLGYGEI